MWFGSPRYGVGLPEPRDFPGAHPPHLPTPGAASPGGRLVSERSCTPSTFASCVGAPPPLHPALPPLHLRVQERPPLFLLVPYVLFGCSASALLPLAATLSHPLGDPDLPARPQFGSLYLVILLSACEF